jgi:hypothetical protein
MDNLVKKAAEVFEQDAQFAQKFMEFTIETGRANTIKERLTKESVDFLRQLWSSKNEKERLDFDIQLLVDNSIITKEEGAAYLDAQYVLAAMQWEKATEKEKLSFNIDYYHKVGAISDYTVKKYKALQEKENV